MAGWVGLQGISAGTWGSLTEDDASGNYSAAEVSDNLQGTLSGSTSDRGDGMYIATSTSGTRLRRWSAEIPSWPTKTFNTPSWVKLGLYGSTNPGAVSNRNLGLWVELGSTSNTGYRAVNVHWLTGGVYQALDAWADEDLPIRLSIEEQTLFSGGEASVHYHVYWQKVGDASPVLLWDSGVRATPGYWAASRVCVFQSGRYTSVVDCSYLLTEVYDEDGPTITETPTSGTNPVSTTPELSYTTTDIAGVSAAAEVTTVDGETAWTGEAEQSGFTVTRTAIADGYGYTIRRTQPFLPGEVVSWTVHTEDSVGNVTESTFTFTCSTSTVAADLAQQNGPRRLLFARIAGYEPNLIENVYPAPTGWSRSVLPCLVAPEEEWSLGLDLATMEVSPSSMMLELENIDDPDDSTGLKKLFARLFATGAICAAGVYIAYLKDSGATQEWVQANATTIAADGATAFTAPGTAHIGQETFSFTGVSSSGFTGCSRGLYPAVGSALGVKYKRPFSDSPDGKLLISSVPYAWNGRMIALYCVTWDETVGNWHHDSEAMLLWVGRIADTVRYHPQRQTWQLQCDHILCDLENELGGDMAKGVLQGINLSGPQGISFQIEQWGYERIITAPADPKLVLDHSATITISAGFYATADDVAKAIQSAMLTAASGWDLSYWDCGRLSNGKFSISVTNEGSTEKVAKLRPWDAMGMCSHALRCLGIDPEKGLYEAHCDDATGNYTDVAVGSATPFTAYHPLDYSCNGERCSFYGAYSGPHQFWSTQGDYGTDRAAFQIKGARVSYETDDGLYLDRYDGNGTCSAIDGRPHTQFEYVTLSDYATRFPGGYRSESYVGQRDGEEPVYAEQVYLPTGTDSSGNTHGPFEQLLYVLLSTGTAGVNHATYDALPLELGLGIPASIVDIQSFLDADAAIAASPLADRSLYLIPEPPSAKDLLLRECQVLGYFLPWDLAKGQLSLKSILPVADTYVEVIDGGIRADADEWPQPESSTGNVLNVFRIECNYDLDAEKYRFKDSIRDQDSRQCLRVTKTIEVQHPGIRITEEYGKVGLKNEVLSRMSVTRLPWPRETVSLAPLMIGRVSIGDWVRFEDERHPDPYGSGLMTCVCLARVDNVYWSLGGDRRWTGRADLSLCARYDALTQVPWAGAALVDSSATNGGWDSTNKRLTMVALQYGLAGDADCGAVFNAGDMIRIRQINPSGYGPATALEWGPIEVASAYETDGAQLLTLAAGTTLTGWDASQEYVVEPARYADAVTAQRALNAWQADTSTRLLGAADRAQRWG